MSAHPSPVSKSGRIKSGVYGRLHVSYDPNLIMATTWDGRAWTVEDLDQAIATMTALRGALISGKPEQETNNDRP